MHPLVRWPYLAAGGLASVASHLAPATSGKLARSLRARRDLAGRVAEWGRERRDPGRPLLWMHAPSVGEGLQARPVLERLRSRRPDVQLAFTFFSPSAESFARALDVDFCDYLPFDTASGAAAMLQALRPTALTYAKLDVWPLLTEAAAAHGVALGVVSATVAPNSSRQGAWARLVLRDAYAALDAVGAVDAADADRLQALGVRADSLVVTGDTRYDQVSARAASVDRAAPLLAALTASPSRPTLVAGSTWPTDEAVLLPAWEAVRPHVPGARLIIAPHEPTEAHLAPIERWSRTRGLHLTRLGSADASAAEVVLVDRVGVLGDLYAFATVAFVGGGFHAAGLHSVLEPAAYGLPVLFGPQHANARDADRLIRGGGGASVVDAGTAADKLRRWLVPGADQRAAGKSARALIDEGLGAADRTFALVQGLLDGRAVSR